MLVDGFRATTQACGYGSRLKAGTTVFFAATSSLRLARNDDVIGDITPDVIDRDRRSRNDRGNDRAGAFAPRRQTQISGITAMDRRHMLKSAASTALGAGLLASAASA